MRRRGTLWAFLFTLLVATSGRAETPHEGPATDLRRGDLRVSANRRFLVHKDGTPFLFIADTAWELFHRATREEVETYLEKRRQQGFTVVMAVALAELDGVRSPNAYGHRPLVNEDPARPDVRPGRDDDYWDFVDFVLDAAARRGMFIGLLPTWADKVGPSRGGKGPLVFDAKKARAYGKFLGQRYRARPNLIWIIGGDRPAVGPASDAEQDYTAIWRAMAAGVREGDGGRHLQSFHPWRPDSSSRWFHHDDWLAFNMLQSGHGAKDWHNWARIAGDYNFWPPKPCLDVEPRYEDHAVNHTPAMGFFDDFDTRQAAYWAVFAGAFGHAYGAHPVWQWWAPGRQPVGHVRRPWAEALDLPGAWDLLHLRRLLLARPFLTRIPDPSVVVSDKGGADDHVESTRDQNGSYAFVYIPTGKTVTVDLRKISGSRVRASWFDPRTGASRVIGEVEPRDRGDFHHTFDPPGDAGRGNDWVLVLDDPRKNDPLPGADVRPGAKPETTKGAPVNP